MRWGASAEPATRPEPALARMPSDETSGAIIATRDNSPEMNLDMPREDRPWWDAGASRKMIHFPI